jgi:hypothetical protein
MLIIQASAARHTDCKALRCVAALCVLLCAQSTRTATTAAASRHQRFHALQVQNALNKRVALQCTLVLTNLDLPRSLNAAEIQAQDDVRRGELQASCAKEDAEQVRGQVDHLLSTLSEAEPGHAHSAQHASDDWVLVQRNNAASITAQAADEDTGAANAHQQEIDAELDSAKQLLRVVELRAADLCAA